MQAKRNQRVNRRLGSFMDMEQNPQFVSIERYSWVSRPLRKEKGFSLVCLCPVVRNRHFFQERADEGYEVLVRLVG